MQIGVIAKKDCTDKMRKQALSITGFKESLTTYCWDDNNKEGWRLMVKLSSKAYLYEHPTVQQVALFGIVMEQEEGAPQ